MLGAGSPTAPLLRSFSGSACRCCCSGCSACIQSEASDIADGRLSWLPYTIVFVVALLLIAITVAQINKTFLNKEDKQ